MRPRPERIERLPQQYFTSLLARVAAVAAEPGERLLDLGRGNPDVPPPAHVVDALVETAREETAAVHGYAPFAGLPELREAIAARYADVYGVELDPHREVAVLPGTKSALVEVALCVAETGGRIALPDPGYPDYNSAVALAGAERVSLPLDKTGRPEWDALGGTPPALLYLNYPSNPRAVAVPEGVFAETVQFAERTGAAVLHDFAYGDLVFDGRAPQSFLAEPGAREVGVELFSLSKSYGMAGWRLGFVVGNAELVARVTWLQEHLRAGIFVALQRAAIAALTGPQETVNGRRALYEARRDRVFAALEPTRPCCEGTFFVWLALPAGWTAERLLTETRVAVAPGEGFGARGEGHVRLSLAVADEFLDAGLERLRQALVAE
ncbi:MAG TPA: aminotransferase class I/II-fold pyridoxal phosphate-dependent enzyme [Gaiellaceae bacterium]|nr:aminotransferase class I/II-fold pyridoxal phosphate-dependent enzyme [Gaiellaceae bacterium]